MKYNPWPTKKEASPAVESKKSTLEKVETNPKKLETCQPTVEDGPIKKD
jgi:hypothetical protein